MAKLIERDTQDGAYGMTAERMIITTESGQRVLLMQQFGGLNSMAGGAYRYRHGLALAVSERDTLASLDAEYARTGIPIAHMRDVLEWDGATIERVAMSAKG